jgi:hypothetical protein
MHVPVYWPVLVGVQPIENSGVVDEMKNVIAMESMPIIVLESIDMEELVELAIAMPDIVLVGDIDIDMTDMLLVGDIDIDIDIEAVELVIEISMAGWVS